MKLVDLAVRKPVVAIVAALMLIVIGLGALERLPIREYPDVDPPIVSVAVTYPGASAEVVERDVTQVIEDNLSGIEGIDQITSTSRAGFAQIDVEFELSRDLDAAAADVRDSVSAVRGDLPDDVEAPVISKASADAQAMMWVTLTSDERDRRALTDIAARDLVDPLSIVPGVAQVVIGGERRYAVRVWLDAQAMAARDIAVNEVTAALRSENLELPGGRIETGPRELTIRTATKFPDAASFQDLVIRAEDGYQITLADIAEVELGAESYRSAIYRSGEPAVGLGIIRQSGSNTLAVAAGVKDELDRLRSLLPADIELAVSYDQSLFIEGSIREVMKTLLITAVLVVGVIYLFLGSLKATLVPAVTIPTSIIATFAVLYALGFTVNTLTLLALVLAIGLVVDDAIVVLENVTRRRELGEPGLLAAVRGGREVALAVVATTAVLVAVLLPIAAIQGTIGRLFTEFAMTLAAAVVFSSFLALTLGTALSSYVAEPSADTGERRVPLRWFSAAITWLEERYGRVAEGIAARGWLAVVIAVIVGASSYFLVQRLPGALAPTEDRAVFIVPVTAPEGASLAETTEIVREIEAILEPYGGEDGPLEDTISIVGTGRQGPPQVTSALLIGKLKPWGEREVGQQDIVAEITPKILAIPGGQAIALNPPSLVADSFGKPIQFVIAGPNYDRAYDWAKTVMDRAQELGTMNNIELDYNEQSPQVRIEIDRRLAADLGLSIQTIGEALRIFFGGDDVTDFYQRGETYEVVIRGAPEDRDAVEDLNLLRLRSGDGALVPLSAVVDLEERGVASSYRRVDRRPSMVISAVPAPGADIASVLGELRAIVEEELPPAAQVDYLGLSKEYAESSGSQLLVFGLALVVVFLVLAALFESFLYPVVILFAAPLAVAGGLFALWLAGMSLNVFSQIGLLLVLGLLAKNAILVVDFANQRRAEGKDPKEAAVEAARSRFRPILMTSIATAFGTIPLILAAGPGSEARQVIGVAVLAGVIGATVITLVLVPGFYRLAARLGGAPGDRDRRLQEQVREAEAQS